MMCFVICKLNRGDFAIEELGIDIFTETCPVDVCFGRNCQLQHFQLASCAKCGLAPTCADEQLYYFCEMCGRAGAVKIVKTYCRNGRVSQNIMNDESCENEGECTGAFCYYTYDIKCDICNDEFLNPALDNLDISKHCSVCKDA